MSKEKHGGFKNHRATYQCWQDMKNRCLNSRSAQFKNYGARGINVEPEWINSFEAFMNDMGLKPPGMTLDRIDNSMGYSKANCRWASVEQQNRNRRGCVHLEFNGKRMTVQEWGAFLGRHPTTIRSRIKAGWLLEDVLDPKPQHRGGNSPPRKLAAMKGTQ